MLEEDLGGADRERRIEKNGSSRYLAALHQVNQIDDEFLGALHRKGRNQQWALASGCISDLSGQARAARIGCDRRTFAVAIGRFRDDIVEARRRLGIGLQQLGIRADVAGTENAERLSRSVFTGEFDLDRRGAEQMPGVPVARANARNHVDPFFVVDRRERLQRGNRIGLRIDRADFGPPARRVAPVQGSNLGLLDAAGVRQHVGTEIDGAARRKDAAGKAVAHQLRQQAAVVDMGMGQEHGVDIRRREKETACSSAPSGFSVPETGRNRPGSVRSGSRTDSRSPSRCGQRRRTGS